MQINPGGHHVVYASLFQPRFFCRDAGPVALNRIREAFDIDI